MDSHYPLEKFPEIKNQSWKMLTQSNAFSNPVGCSNPNNVPEKLFFKSNSPYYVNLHPKLAMSSTQKKFMSAQNFHINPQNIHEQTNLLPDKAKQRYNTEIVVNHNLNNRKEDLNCENIQLFANKGKEKFRYDVNKTVDEDYQDNRIDCEEEIPFQKRNSQKNDNLMKRFKLIRNIMLELK